MTTTTNTEISTSNLWQQTHEALIAKKWSTARALLDDLCRRNDNHDELCHPEVYGVPEMMTGVIGDRIDLVNAKV